MDDFQKLLDKLSKTHDTPIGSMESVAIDAPSISTRNVTLDWITGIGGLPIGRSVELFGPPSSGKTTLALQVAAEAQSRGLVVAYFDFEQAMDRVYAQALGIDVGSLVFTQPDMLESGADMAVELLKSGTPDLMIFDSVAAMTPAVLMETEVGKDTVGLQARRLHHFMQKLNPLLKESNCCAVFLNHTREKIGTYTRPGMSPLTTTPGGGALKYYASMRIEFRTGAKIKEELETALSPEKSKVVTGETVWASCVKNKIGPPYRSDQLRMHHGLGFSQAFSVFKILLDHKVIKKKTGGIFSVPDSILQGDWMSTSDKNDVFVRGEANLLRGLEEHPDTLLKWVSVAQKVLRSGAGEGSLAEPAEIISAAPALEPGSESLSSILQDAIQEKTTNESRVKA